ncbi:unnamed protein product [Ambrosiozyma monospora]|uniref:Unnamed protein product n=1 Tax=Ambrosiozyma monospora TaxID=43982 RepID=A0A9W6Z073_AMBMO|nr:unnamed protein product [Ambrosiozyma monospora]
MAVPIAVSDYSASPTTAVESQLATVVSTALAESTLLSESDSSDEEPTEAQMKSIGSFFKSIGTKLRGVGGKVGTAVDVISIITTGAGIISALIPSKSSSNGTVVDTDGSGNVSISSKLSAVILSAATATDISPELEAAVSSAMALAETASDSTATRVVETSVSSAVETAVKEVTYASNSSSSSLPAQTSLSFDDLTEVQQKKIANLGALFSKVVSNMNDALSLGNGVLSLINNSFTVLNNFKSSKTTTSATATTTPVGAQVQVVNYAVANPQEADLAPQIASALMYAMSVASASATPSSEAQLKRRYAASASYAAQSAYTTGSATATASAAVASASEALDQFDPQVKSLGSLFGKVIGLLVPELGVASTAVNVISTAVGLLKAASSANSKEVVAPYIGKEIAAATISGAPSATSIDIAPLIASAVSSAMAAASASATTTA